MSLDDRDRRVLDGLEQALAASDPKLVAAFARAAEPAAARRARTTWVCFLVVSLLLLVTGLVLHDAETLTGGLLVLACAPVVVWIVSVVPGCRR